VGCPGDGLVTAPAPADEAAALEDVDEDGGDEDLCSLPQPVIVVPTTMVPTAQPATVIRASSMGIPSTSIRAWLDIQQFGRGA
jgi:hypothetical protein